MIDQEMKTVFVKSSGLELDDATPVQADGTVRCSQLGETADGMIEVQLQDAFLQRVWVVSPQDIVR